MKETDVDRKFLKRAGVDLEETELGEAPVLKPLPCGHCHYVNPPTGRFCSKCGSPLTEEAVAEVLEDEKLIEKGFEPSNEDMIRKLLLEMKEMGEL